MNQSEGTVPFVDETNVDPTTIQTPAEVAELRRWSRPAVWAPRVSSPEASTKSDGLPPWLSMPVGW